jgi:hypothetical protein
MTKKLPLSDFRAVRHKLEPHEFAISEEQDAPRTTVNHAMKTARSAWKTVSRANPGLFPPRNPPAARRIDCEPPQNHRSASADS